MRGMSPAGLKRCRTLLITDEGDESVFRKRLEVIDPRKPGHPVASLVVRTRNDFERVKRSYMGRFRIPLENVEETSSG